MALSIEEFAFLAVLFAMGLNQLVMRLGALYSRPGVFYGLQVLNLVIGSGIILLGLPGFERFPVVSWLVGLLFFFRTVQNNQLRQQWLRVGAHTAVDARRAEILAALRSSDDEDDEDDEE